jgi:hypothetical protein
MSEETIEEEVLLSFRRFSADKQDQVRALVNYATLMGLNGKDLMSIGGKLDRIAKRRELERDIVIAEELCKSCTLVGNDKKAPNTRDIRRWTYTDGSGRKWAFNDADYWQVQVTSDTGVKKRFRNLDRYDIGRAARNGSWNMKQTMLNLHHGKIVLNF